MFRRPFRLVIPASLALAFCSILKVSGAFKYAAEVSYVLTNQTAAGPTIWESTITYFNSCTGIIMDYSLRKDTRGSAFLPPSNMGWILAVVFQQTYCIAVIAYILPYAVLSWKIRGAILFGLAAWWSGVWVWYSTFFICLAEFSVVYSPLLKPTWPLRLPGKRVLHIKQQIGPLLLLITGVALKYSWASFPTHLDDELVAHPDPTSGALNWNYNPLIATPRVDNFLVVSATFMLIEVTPSMHRYLNVGVLKYFGSLAFSSFLTSGSIMLATGSALFHYLVAKYNWNSHDPLLLFILFITTIPASLVFSLFWRYTVDDGTLLLSRFLYKWFTK
jgi:hypothetical protein